MKKAFLLILLGSMALVSCGGGRENAQPSSENGAKVSSSSSTSGLAAGDPSERPSSLLIGGHKPGQAPTDYEGMKTQEINDSTKSGAFITYFLAEHQLANNNFFTYISSSSVTAKMGGQTAYSQYVSGFRAVVDNVAFAQSITVKGEGGVAGSLSSLKISKALQKYENLNSEQYAYRENQKSDTIKVEQKQDDTNGSYLIGSIDEAEFNQPVLFNTDNDFVETLGHNIWGITSYTVPNSNALLSAELVSLEPLSCRYSFTTSDSAIDGVDASYGYAIEQQNMISDSSSMIKIVINSLEMSLTVDENFFPVESVVTEQYTCKVLGLNVVVTTQITNKFVKINTAEDISIPEYKEAYENGVSAFSKAY